MRWTFDKHRGGMRRMLLRRALWVLLAVFAWMPVSSIAQFVGSILGFVLPFGSPFEWLAQPSEWLAFALLGLVAYGFVRVLREIVHAPRSVWLGVAVIEGLGLGVFLIAFIVLLLGQRLGWLELALTTNGAGGVESPVHQLAMLFSFRLPSSLAPIVGAWLAARRPTESEPSSPATRSFGVVEHAHQADAPLSQDSR